MSSLGAGVGLNRDFDFEVDTTGDLATVTELDELEKDVAFNVARTLQESIGQPVTSSTAKELQVDVRDVLIEDSRINVVGSVTIRRIQRTNTYEVVAEVTTAEGPFELVFEVQV